MNYRLVTGDESTKVLTLVSAHYIGALPSYGVIVSIDAKSYLVFEKQDSTILVIDVSEKVPAQFTQVYPATPSFYDEVTANFKDLLTTSFNKIIWPILIILILILAVQSGAIFGKR
jgi:hypothetical protein